MESYGSWLVGYRVGALPDHEPRRQAGAFLSDIFLLMFGCIAFLFPFLLVLGVWSALRDRGGKDEKSFKMPKVGKSEKNKKTVYHQSDYLFS